MEKTLNIDSYHKGNVNFSGVVVIGPEGSVFGDIISDDVRISGKVDGDVYAKNTCYLGKNGELNGEVFTDSFGCFPSSEFIGRRDKYREPVLVKVIENNVKNKDSTLRVEDGIKEEKKTLKLF